MGLKDFLPPNTFLTELETDMETKKIVDRDDIWNQIGNSLLNQAWTREDFDKCIKENKYICLPDVSKLSTKWGRIGAAWFKYAWEEEDFEHVNELMQEYFDFSHGIMDDEGVGYYLSNIYDRVDMVCIDNKEYVLLLKFPF